MPLDGPGTSDPTAAALSLALSRRVAAACDCHEGAWHAGLRPRIEDQLGRCRDPDPPELLAELLAVEVRLRLGAGERPAPEEYLARFPGRGAAIEAAFRGRSPQAPGGSGYPPPGSPFEPTWADGTVFLAPEASSHAPGGGDQDLSDFELLEEVARGNMGIVYKARKRSLNCLVALKVMLAGPRATELERRRFLLEAEVAANLDHPNIVPVYEVDRAGGLFFTMRWVEGGNLALQVARLVADPVAAARLLALVARAVHDAHQNGYLHRDLKPTNILVDLQGRPHLTDFGLALRVGEDSDLTQPGAVLGTPSYMAPEQAAGKGREIGPPADVYSLGAILYELLTGRTPFRAGTVMETLVLVLEKDPVPPSRLRPGTPRELEAICLKCLEKGPEERYPSAEALAEDLERFLRGDEVRALRGGAWRWLRRWSRREPQLVARLMAVGACEALAQVNYALSPARQPLLHLQVTATLAAWALACILLQGVARQDRWWTGVRVAWSVADSLFLTLILHFLDAVGSSMVVGYPLLVAASGLWFRVRLVWLATALAELGYLLLLLDAWGRDTLGRHDHHPNIVIAAIAVAGFIVVRQVERLLILSSFYENRLPD